MSIPVLEWNVADWLIFDTHPIQYRTPVFKALLKSRSSFQVYFFGQDFDGRKFWFHEVGKIPEQNFNLDLTHGFPNETLNSKTLGLLGFHKTVRKLLKKEKPSGVVIYGWYLPEHWIIWWNTFRLSIPLVFVGETFSEGTSFFRKALKKVLHPLFFSNVSHIISIGEKNSAFYRKLRINESKMTQAKYCIDTAFFEGSSEAAREKIREEFGIPNSAFVLLFVGRLFDRKRPQDVVRLHQALSDLDIYTLIVGNGPLEQSLKDAISGTPRIQMLGFRNQAQIRDIYRASDVLVVPSEYETWGLVVNEAFACGLPALVTDTCGVAGDLVVENLTGASFPVGDITRASAIVRNWIEKPEIFLRLCQNAKRKVLSEYRVDQFAEAMNTAFQKIKAEIRG